MEREPGSGGAAPLTIALVGDVRLGRGVARAADVYGVDHPLGAVVPLLAEADLTFADLACALTSRLIRAEDAPDRTAYLRADPRHVEVLRRAGVDAVSVANNHVGDYGSVGLLDTLAALTGAGIGHAGAGADLGAASAPVRIARRGWRVSLLAFTDHPAVWAAGPSTAGVRFVARDAAGLARARAAIAAERPFADLLVVSVHTGAPPRERPDAAARGFARALEEAGADVVWGHGAHMVQGVEWAHGRPILYDTGDLVNDESVDPLLRNDRGGVFHLRAQRGAVEGVEVLPTRIRGMRALLAEGAERDRALAHLAAASEALGTAVTVEGGRLRSLAPVPALT